MRRSTLRLFLAGFVASVASSGAFAEQAGETTEAQQRHIVIPPATVPATDAPNRINSTGRAITLTVPAKDGAIYLGDIVVTIDAEDQIDFSAQRLLDLLSNVLDPDVQRTLLASFAGKTTLMPADFRASGIGIHYNPQQIALELEIPSELRATRNLQVSPINGSRIGTFAQPADFSAYLNVRGNLDYLSDGGDHGFQSPLMFLDGAARVGGVVAESEAIWQPGVTGVDFQRLGSRLVYDDQSNLVRWTAGDLQAVARGFQAAPDMAGISVFRSYGVLQPQMIVRPRGDRQFTLQRSSTVEIEVNGQIVQRVQLAPGNYNLRDFPFTQGANDVKLSILDDTGRSEILRFNVFLDQSQLAQGLSEFGFYAGVAAPQRLRGPHYTNDWTVTGFYRRGVTDRITLGANLQADRRVKMGGVEGVFGTPLGTIGVNFSLSDIKGYGTGYGTIVTFQRLIQRGGGRADSLTLSFESRSRDFGPLDTVTPDNRFSWEVGGGYSHAFNDALYAGLDAHFSKGRDAQRDIATVRGTVGWRITPLLSMTGDLRYERDNIGSRMSGLLSLTLRLGRYSNVRADYDTHNNRARIAYQALHGQGVGAYNISVDAERSDFGAGVNGVVNYVANRAEIGLSHFGTFTDDFGQSIGQRTSLRVASSIAVADGAVSIGRPIYDSFAIVEGHSSLKDAEVVIDPTPFGYTASSGVLGAATQPSLSSYAERTITVDVPEAPAGFDLGQGSFRLFPAYRSGYRLEVGSDYNVTALGRMLNADGEPVSLVSGAAIELAHPEREKVTLFTNRDGRFGAVGLAPGRWRLEMLDDQHSTYVIDIPEQAEGVLRLGDLHVSNGE